MVRLLFWVSIVCRPDPVRRALWGRPGADNIQLDQRRRVAYGEGGGHGRHRRDTATDFLYDHFVYNRCTAVEGVHLTDLRRGSA